MGYDYYVKERNGGLVKNPGMSNIGNCSWRPLIMKLELEKMDDKDILVYRDCNVLKYKFQHTKDQYKSIKKIIDECLHDCQFDFFVPRESYSLSLKTYVKTNIIRELGENHPFTYNFPILFSGLLTIARKSPVSLELLNDWKQACEKEEWIDGETYGPLYYNFRHSTPEQGLLCVVISNWIRQRKHNIPTDYPKVIFSERNLLKKKTYDEKKCSYLCYIDSNVRENYLGQWSNSIPDDFNWKTYISLYNDLKIHIKNEEQAKAHYLINGIFEHYFSRKL